MKVETFMEHYKQCKKSQIMTGYSDRTWKLKVTVNPERTHFTITKEPIEKICKHCGTDLTKHDYNSLIIDFNRPQETLSVFQAYMLWMMHKMKVIPYDYANYHKCIAGQRFIENIKVLKGGQE